MRVKLTMTFSLSSLVSCIQNVKPNLLVFFPPFLFSWCFSFHVSMSVRYSAEVMTEQKREVLSLLECGVKWARWTKWDEKASYEQSAKGEIKSFRVRKALQGITLWLEDFHGLSPVCRGVCVCLCEQALSKFLHLRTSMHVLRVGFRTKLTV